MLKKLILISAMTAPAFGVTWVTYNGHEYALTDSPGTWTASESIAESFGGTLAIINDAAEQDFINGTFAQSISWMWIGFTDQDEEGTFEWIDGSPVTYTNWTPGEPNNSFGIEHYTIMNWSGTAWNDIGDAEPVYGIMERNAAVPEVQTYATMLGAVLVGANILQRRRKSS